MAADIKVKYPTATADTVAVTITLASLASNTNLLVGREATAIANDSNLDLDHILSGKIRAGTSPTAGNRIEVWAFAPRLVASGTPTWPQGATGSDAGLTLNSDNAKSGGWLKLVASITVDNTTGRDYDFGGISVATLFGGSLPSDYSIWVANGSGVALDSTGGNHSINYQRIQAQTV